MTLVPLLGLVLAAMAGAGGALLRASRLPIEDPLERHCFGLTVGYAVVAILVTLLGLASLLYASTFLILLPLLALLGLRDVLALVRGVLSALRGALRDWRSRCAALAIGVVGLGAFACALAPPTFVDVLNYHFAMPLLYARAHGFPTLPLVQQTSMRSYAQSVHAMAFLLEGERLATLVIVFVNILHPFLLYAGARRRWGRRSAVAALVLFVSMPVYAAMFAFPLVDIATALFGTAALFALLDWVESGRDRWLGASALFCGFAVGMKLNALGLALVFFLVASYLVLRARPLHWWLVPAICGAAASVAAPILWLNLRDFGNPLFPFFHGVLGGAPGPRRVLELKLLPLWEALAFPLKVSLSYVSVGPQFLFVAPLAVFLRPGGATARVALSWGLLGMGVMTALTVYSSGSGMQNQHYMDGGRYSLFFLPPFALFCGTVVDRLLSLPGRHNAALLAFLGAGLLLACAQFVNSTASRASAVLKRISRDEFLRARVPTYDTMRYANDHLPADSLTYVLYYYVYYFDRPYASELEFVGLVEYDELDSSEAYARWMDERGITHLLVPPPPLMEKTFLKFQRRCPDVLQEPYFIREFEGPDGSVLYRRARP